VVAPTGDHQLAALMRTVADRALERSADLELLFVTNLHTGVEGDLGPDGVLNAAQFYTRRQADDIIRSFQSLGLTVTSFFNEVDFISAVTRAMTPTTRRRLVYTTAEGGTGSGRRALIPALCNLLSLPFLNSSAHASTLARHKFHANAVLRRVGVRVPETWHFAAGRWIADLAPLLGTRVIVKPMWESMCIGVSDDSVRIVDGGFAEFVTEREHRFNQPVLVQEFVSGDEVGVPVARIGATHALPPVAFCQADGEPFAGRPRTFEDEILTHNVSLIPYPPSQPLAEAAVLAFDALGMSGAGRIDFRVDVDGRGWVFDTNESPPPLADTSYATSMQRLGFDLEEMLAVWLGICLLDFGLISAV
jgi:D-alanine-D-alanine ligase